jgi:hypothetical protein
LQLLGFEIHVKKSLVVLLSELQSLIQLIHLRVYQSLVELAMSRILNPGHKRISVIIRLLLGRVKPLIDFFYRFWLLKQMHLCLTKWGIYYTNIPKKVIEVDLGTKRIKWRILSSFFHLKLRLCCTYTDCFTFLDVITRKWVLLFCNSIKTFL